MQEHKHFRLYKQAFSTDKQAVEWLLWHIKMHTYIHRHTQADTHVHQHRTGSNEWWLMLFLP